MTRSTQGPARQNDSGSSMSKLTQGPNVPRLNDKKREREIAAGEIVNGQLPCSKVQLLLPEKLFTCLGKS